ncbi:hypothetical protein RMSM_07109 [Rhodopirellula maiorica SM1]|uniref:Uncharacterized protein n=1 Tax=Rhodopirellula maiorica SM1 TaxID=1265738 RepID=M5R918_9BACT|nr:hypothetical protein RMSM_07109 [Rhodopirellula maiorica SM1]
MRVKNTTTKRLDKSAKSDKTKRQDCGVLLLRTATGWQVGTRVS